MVNITHKVNTLRQAIATAIVKVSKQETIDAIQQRKVPKGDVFEFSRAAGLLAIKKTSDVIPDCHPLPIEYAAIHHTISDQQILIRVEVRSIYKTGVEVEAMHGAAIAALTIYDMLKPIDNGIEITSIKLESKHGGKRDFRHELTDNLRSAVIVCSDTVSKGVKHDTAGKAISEKLKQCGIAVTNYEIIADEFKVIQEKANQFSEANYALVIFTGGTGLSPRDVTPDAIQPLLSREIPGVMEAARNYGQQRMPYAMLSRGVAGFIKSTLVITLPGSPKGVAETIDAIFPYVLHVFRVKEGVQHEK